MDLFEPRHRMPIVMNCSHQGDLNDILFESGGRMDTKVPSVQERVERTDRKVQKSKERVARTDRRNVPSVQERVDGKDQMERFDGNRRGPIAGNSRQNVRRAKDETVGGNGVAGDTRENVRAQDETGGNGETMFFYPKDKSKTVLEPGNWSLEGDSARDRAISEEHLRDKEHEVGKRWHDESKVSYVRSGKRDELRPQGKHCTNPKDWDPKNGAGERDGRSESARNASTSTTNTMDTEAGEQEREERAKCQSLEKSDRNNVHRREPPSDSRARPRTRAAENALASLDGILTETVKLAEKLVSPEKAPEQRENSSARTTGEKPAPAHTDEF